MKKSDFVFDKESGRLSAGSEIAEAVILCKRPTSYPLANQTFLAQFQFSGEINNLPTAEGTKIFIEIKENLILDPTLIQDSEGESNYAKGFGIGEIKAAQSWPTHENYLKLYEIQGEELVDLRKAISLPAIDEVAQKTSTLEEKITTAEGQISQLVEAGTPSYLGITAIVGEKYTMEDTLFLQKTPTLEDSTIAINVGDTAANKEQHIQRISSGGSSSNIKLKMDKFGLPTTSVIVEVRKGVKVDVNEKEAFRYGGDELLASASLPYTTFNTEAQEITVNLNQAFQLPKGELYSVVVKQENGIVNGQNFYRLYCDSTQYSEAFSVVAVNGSSRVRSKLMPYCVSEGLVEESLSKNSDEIVEMEGDVSLVNEGKKSYYLERNQKKILHTFTGYKKLHISWGAASSGSEYGFAVKVNGVNRYNWGSVLNNEVVCDPTDVVTIVAENNSSFGRNLEYSYLKIKNKKPSLKKNNTELLPRKLVAIGESVATTLLGLHTDNNWKPYEKKQAKNLDLTINQYRIDSQRVAPSDGFLIVRFFEGLNSGITIGQDYFYVNNATLKITIPVFVRKGIVPIQSGSAQTHIKLLYFIPL